MFTIEEIKKRKIEGKRKWGGSLILLIQDKLDEDLPIESIVEYLKETYDFALTVGDLYQLKSKYYVSKPKSTEELSYTISAKNTSVKQKSGIEQISDLTDAEKMYDDIYKKEIQKTVFDLGRDF